MSYSDHGTYSIMTVNQSAQTRSVSSKMNNVSSAHQNASTARVNQTGVPSAKLICALMRRTTTAWQYARQMSRYTIKTHQGVTALQDQKSKLSAVAARAATKIVKHALEMWTLVHLAKRASFSIKRASALGHVESLRIKLQSMAYAENAQSLATNAAGR